MTRPITPAPEPPRRRTLVTAMSLGVILLAAIAGLSLVFSNRGPAPRVPTTLDVTAATLVPDGTDAPAFVATEAPAASPLPTSPAIATETPIPPTPTMSPTITPTEAPITPTEAPTQTPEPTATPEQQTYVVKAGDSCYAIAQRFRVRVDDIIAINKLRANCFIQPGNVLVIPQR
jgi:hypothetical protein